MLDEVKARCGIVPEVTVYDGEISGYIGDAGADLIASGVDASLVEAEKPGVVTAVTLYVKAHLGDDRSDTEKYMDMYRKKVFRLTLEDPVEDDG